MIRQPTSPEVQYGWHRNSMLGAFAETTPEFTEEPQCGFYKRRLVKGGIEVPAKIWLVQVVEWETEELIEDEVLQCEVNGEWRDVEREWPWLCQNPISEADFNYMMANKQWAAWHAPDDPAANPKEKINWATVRPPEFRKDEK